MGRSSKQSGRKIAARLGFLAYCALMLWLLFGQRMGVAPSADNINLIPLETIRLYLRLKESANPYFVQHAYVNLIGNVVMFVPLGILLPWIWPGLRSFFKVLFLVLLVVILIEILQYFTRLGSCDIDDLILNVPGAMLGYGFWRIFCRKT